VSLRVGLVLLGAVAIAACGVWLSACGGEAPPPPATAANVNDAGPASPVTQGSAQAIPVQHAEVTGAAKSSYDRGYKAFSSGDLVGAKQAFLEATRADSSAPAPHYALGTVLDRRSTRSLTTSSPSAPTHCLSLAAVTRAKRTPS
jgi:hypothetical protein